MTDHEQPALPYAGTSGWSGSETSRERAETQDTDGTTSERLARTLGYLGRDQAVGVTWKELAVATGWHHGQASGVLSVLHKAGRIARLTERRNRCAVYVLPEYVNGRETAPHGRQRDRLTEQERAVAWAFAARARAENGDTVTMSQVNTRILLHALARLSGETFTQETP